MPPENSIDILTTETQRTQRKNKNIEQKIYSLCPLCLCGVKIALTGGGMVIGTHDGEF
jgi:hypothetical protein